MKLQIQIALRNLLRAGRRTLLVSVAVAGVTFFLVLLLSLTQGIRENVVRSATTLFSGHVNVSGFFKPTASEAEPITLETARVRQLLREHVDGVTNIVDRTQGIAQIVSHTDSTFALVMGIDVEEEKSFSEVVELAAESEYVEGGDPEKVVGSLEGLENEKSVLLFASQAERLGVGVGDGLTLRAETFSGVANTVDVTVVAVVRDVGLLSNFAVFVPKQTLRELYDLREDATGLVMVYLEDPDRAWEAMGTVRRVLDEKGDYRVLEHDPQPTFQKLESLSNADWTGYRIDVSTWEDAVSFLLWMLTAVNTVSFIIILVLCVLIGVGIVNTMVMAVRDRTAEIGTMRAMGATRLRVMALFMLEALMMAFAASLLGGALGVGTALAIDAAEYRIPIEAVQAILMSDVLHLAPTVRQVGIAIVGMTGFVSLAALWPALQAARLTPVDAMRRSD